MISGSFSFTDHETHTANDEEEELVPRATNNQGNTPPTAEEHTSDYGKHSTDRFSFDGE